jgi:hypothetical protein
MSPGTRIKVLMTGAPEQAKEAINKEIYPFELCFENKCRAEVRVIFT